MYKLNPEDYPMYVSNKEHLDFNLNTLRKLTQLAATTYPKYFSYLHDTNESHPTKIESQLQTFLSKKEKKAINRDKIIQIDYDNIISFARQNFHIITAGIKITLFMNEVNVDTKSLYGVNELIKLILKNVSRFQKSLTIIRDQINTFNNFINELNIKIVGDMPLYAESLTTMIVVQFPKTNHVLINTPDDFVNVNDKSGSPISINLAGKKSIDKNYNLYKFRLSDGTTIFDSFDGTFKCKPKSVFFGLCDDNYDVNDEHEFSPKK